MQNRKLVLGMGSFLGFLLLGCPQPAKDATDSKDSKAQSESSSSGEQQQKSGAAAPTGSGNSGGGW
jgi:hypothetical protein